jgi:hypothetical protein
LSGSSSPLVLEPSRSRALRLIVILLYLVALLPGLLLPLPWWARPLWMLVLGAAFYWEWRRVDAAPPRLRYVERTWEFEESAGEWRAQRLRDWYASPLLCVLSFAEPRRTVLLPADALPAEQHRQLRVLLRTQDPRE